jgi:hypothetical protein
MQSNSASKKKTSKAAEAVPSPVELNTAPAPKPRASTSSKTKSESGESTSAKRHRKPAAAAASEETTTIIAERAAVEGPIAKAEGISPAVVASKSSPGEEEVRKLAYLYWIERGRPHGSHHQDWFRAEQSLAS